MEYLKSLERGSAAGEVIHNSQFLILNWRAMIQVERNGSAHSVGLNPILAQAGRR
jgi:hypothetical protein